MGIDLLGFVLIQGHEAVEDIVACGGIVGSTFCNIRFLVLPPVGSILVELAFIIREVVLHGAHGKLLLESVDLVQKQDDGRFDEPPRIANGIKQGQGLLHTVDRFVLEEQLIILGDGHQKQNRSDILKAVDPFLSLGPLATYIKHSVSKFTNDEGRLGDSGGLDTRT